MYLGTALGPSPDSIALVGEFSVTSALHHPKHEDVERVSSPIPATRNSHDLLSGV